MTAPISIKDWDSRLNVKNLATVKIYVKVKSRIESNILLGFSVDSEDQQWRHTFLYF